MRQQGMVRKFGLAAAAMLLTCGAATAGPTPQVVAGQTTVALDPGFVGALSSLGIAPSPIAPGSLAGGSVSYPIPGGVLDLGSARGDLFHVGGLALSAPGTEVGLLNFVISTTGAPLLTGIVTLNGDVVDRLPLFDLDLAAAEISVVANTVTIGNVGVFLTDVAAATLSDVFGAPGAIPGGFEVGVATVVAQAAPMGVDPDDDDESGDDESLDDDEGSDDRSWRRGAWRR